MLDSLVRSLRAQDWRLLAKRRPEQEPWTLQDVLVHVTYWKADVARFALGKRRPVGERGLGTHEHNRLVFETWRDREVADVLAYHRQVQEDVMAALQEASESWISGRERAPHWPADLDIHSAAHRVRDIGRILAEAGVSSARSSG